MPKSDNDSKKTEFLYDLEHKSVNPSAYRKARLKVHMKLLGPNVGAFGWWLLKDLLWLALPYIAYGYHQQLLNRTMLLTQIDSKTLWGMGQNLTLAAIVTGALLIVSGLQIVKQGWFHRPITADDYVATLKTSVVKELKGHA